MGRRHDPARPLPAADMADGAAADDIACRTRLAAESLKPIVTSLPATSGSGTKRARPSTAASRGRAGSSPGACASSMPGEASAGRSGTTSRQAGRSFRSTSSCTRSSRDAASCSGTGSSGASGTGFIAPGGSPAAADAAATSRSAPWTSRGGGSATSATGPCGRSPRGSRRTARVSRTAGTEPGAPPAAGAVPPRPGSAGRGRLIFFDRPGRFVENKKLRGGGVAQLGEHHVRNVGVEGSIPFSSTIFRPVFRFREKWRLEPGD